MKGGRREQGVLFSASTLQLLKGLGPREIMSYFIKCHS